MNQYLKKIATFTLLCLLTFQMVFTLETVRPLESTFIPRGTWSPNAYIKLTCNPGAGMFFGLMCLLGALEVYESRQAAGVEVAYGSDGVYGPYHDPSLGDNFWEYYYEPLAIGISAGNNIIATVNGNAKMYFSSIALNRMNRKRAHFLLSRYVHVKAPIQEKVDQFVQDNFKSTMLAVHYRGTDKHTEAPRVSYARVVRAIQKTIKKLDTEDFQIFVATDEKAFLDHMNILFPGIILSYEGITRSKDGQPVHLNASNPYQVGEEAIIDCLLLSRCDAIIRTTSHLSHMATFFNPLMDEIVVK